MLFLYPVLFSFLYLHTLVIDLPFVSFVQPALWCLLYGTFISLHSVDVHKANNS